MFRRDLDVLVILTAADKDLVRSIFISELGSIALARFLDCTVRIHPSNRFGPKADSQT